MVPSTDAFHVLAPAQSTDLFGEVAPWLAVLLAGVIVGGVVIFMIRKRVFGDDGSSAAVGFTLHDLREMHASGEITDEEFERAKDQMIGRLRSEAAPDEAAEDGKNRPPVAGNSSDSRPENH